MSSRIIEELVSMGFDRSAAEQAVNVGGVQSSNDGIDYIQQHQQQHAATSNNTSSSNNSMAPLVAAAAAQSRANVSSTTGTSTPPTTTTTTTSHINNNGINGKSTRLGLPHSHSHSHPHPHAPPPSPATNPTSVPVAEPLPLTSTRMDTSADPELAEAIRLSLQPSPVTVSSQSQHPGLSSVSADDQAAQEAIMASILSSPQTQILNGVWIDSENPHQRKRMPGMPVGLKNIGNICYFNSLIQVYFHLRPVLFQTIMSIHTTQHDADTEMTNQQEQREQTAAQSNHAGSPAAASVSSSTLVPATSSSASASVSATASTSTSASSSSSPLSVASLSLAFVSELQRLFAFLHYSQRKYLDPMSCVTALFNASGHTTQEQKVQHDAAEFNDLIIDTINTAYTHFITHSNTSDLTRDPTLIQKMFFGLAEQEVYVAPVDDHHQQHVDQSSSSPSPTPSHPPLVLPVTPVKVGPLILDISSGSLYSALDTYTSSIVPSYRVSDTLTVPANISLWFQSFPAVLCFQLQRVGYDNEKKEAIKNNSRFTFDDVIWLDRYDGKQRAQAEQRRQQVKHWKKDKEETERKMQELTDYQSKGIPLHSALDIASHYLQHTAPASGKTEEQQAAYKRAVELLSAHSMDVSTRLSHLSSHHASLCSLINTAYDSLNSVNNAYELFAVLVHDGREAGQGHYWSYIKNLSAETPDSSNRWWRYNDAIVSGVDANNVWLESEGGQPTKSASAYFLIYIQQSNSVIAHTPTDIESMIPASLKQLVDEDNQKLYAEMVQYDEKQHKKLIDSESNTIRTEFIHTDKIFTETVVKYRAQANRQVNVDIHAYSLPVYLAFSQQENLGRFVLLNEMLLHYSNQDELTKTQIITDVYSKLNSMPAYAPALQHASSPSSPITNKQVYAGYEELYLLYRQMVNLHVNSMYALYHLRDVSLALCYLIQARELPPSNLLVHQSPQSCPLHIQPFCVKHQSFNAFILFYVYLLFHVAKEEIKVEAAKEREEDRDEIWIDRAVKQLLCVSSICRYFPSPGLEEYFQTRLIMLSSELDGKIHNKKQRQGGGTQTQQIEQREPSPLPPPPTTTTTTTVKAEEKQEEKAVIVSSSSSSSAVDEDDVVEEVHSESEDEDVLSPVVVAFIHSESLPRPSPHTVIEELRSTLITPHPQPITDNGWPSPLFQHTEQLVKPILESFSVSIKKQQSAATKGAEEGEDKEDEMLREIHTHFIAYMQTQREKEAAAQATNTDTVTRDDRDTTMGGTTTALSVSNVDVNPPVVMQLSN